MEAIDLKNLEILYTQSYGRKQREIDKNYRLYLEKILEKDPEDVQTLIYLGFLYQEPFHREDKAIECLRKAIRLDPKNIEARFWLAQCFYHDLCNYDESKKLLIQGLAIDPSRADCLEALAAIIEDTTQDYEESSNYLLKAIHYQPNWPNLRCYLASIYIKQKKLILAKQELDQAIILSQFPLKVPKSPIEDYYETIITGRANRNLGDSFIRLKKRILQLISV